MTTEVKEIEIVKKYQLNQRKTCKILIQSETYLKERPFPGFFW